MRYEDVRVIHAPLDRLWAILTDVEGWPDWTPTMRRIERLDTGPFAVGSKARITQPGRKPMVWTVTGLEDGRAFTWQATAPGLRLTGEHALTPVDGGTSTVNALTLSGPLAPITALLLGRTTRQSIATESDGLATRAQRD